MSTVFPTNIDSFSNPITTKANGLDFVKAEHVNDLQDSVRAIQQAMIGSGYSMNIGSNYFLPGDASVKSSLEILDGSLEAQRVNLQTHLGLVMLTDASQHHANVIEISSGSGAVLADIGPARVQTALEVIRQEINLILTGDYVRGQSLSDLYILRAGPATVTGALTVEDAFQASSDVVLGVSASNTVSMAGSCSITGTLDVTGNLGLSSHVNIAAGMKIGQASQLDYSHISFGELATEIYSMHDLIIKLDSDGLVNPLGQNSALKVLDAVGVEVFSANELGQAIVKEGLTTKVLSALQEAFIGDTEKLNIQENLLSTEAESLQIVLDNNNGYVSSKLTVSKDGYTGTDLNNADLLLQVDESQLVSPTTVLKPGLMEDGQFALKFFSANPGGVFNGYFVPFRQKKLSIPSVNITVDLANSVNQGTVQTSHVSEYGFFIECDSVTVGEVFLRGTYEA